MPAILMSPDKGRGAWPSSGVGGTLRSDGKTAGRFYRSPATGVTPPVSAPGSVGAKADRDGTECSVDDYAVYRATLAVQVELRERGVTANNGRTLSADGVWGEATTQALKTWQAQEGLTADGVYGPATSKKLWLGHAIKAAEAATDTQDTEVSQILVGTVGYESNWDLGAVGVSDPMDIGMCQINGRAHPTMSINDRLNPKLALPFAARLVTSNLVAMKGNVRDAVAAYNLGVTGCRRWIEADRPQFWLNRDIWKYIDTILGVS